MRIKNGFDFTDELSGLRLTVIDGEMQDRLQISNPSDCRFVPRDFWFDKHGEMTGQQSPLQEVSEYEYLKRTVKKLEARITFMEGENNEDQGCDNEQSAK